jgi:hypothetical protein
MDVGAAVVSVDWVALASLWVAPTPEYVPLSNCMINRCINMSHDAEEVLHDELKNNSFSIQVDGSTDFTNTSYVVAFVRFVNDGEIQENHYCCKELPQRNKRAKYI